MTEARSSVEGRKGKNIIVCCDGTGNKFIDDPKSEDSNSNVVKFYTALRIYNDQVGYYHPGVGTAGAPAAKNWLARKWSVLKGLAFAAGFKDNVLDAYQYLMNTYDDGDRVYLIGFSRGSYTVRALAGLLDGYGLLCKGNEGHLPYAWNEYVKQHDDRGQHHVEPNKAFKETFSRPEFGVRFIGVWDTVSSVGWINTPLRLFNIAQSPIFEIGRHAISIDERRCFYRDNLWGEAEAGQDILQVWFPGVHSDIGGSYPQIQSGLANDALEWMLGEADRAGAEIKPHMKTLLLGERPIPPTNDPIEDRRVKVLEGLYRKPEPHWHLHHSLKGVWWLLELLPHRYYDKDDEQENWRTPLGLARRMCKGELVHRSVVDGMEKHGYKPKNVRDGVKALKPVEIQGQPAGSIYKYEPLHDPKPLTNNPAVRLGVMAAVSAADLLVLGLVVKGLWTLGRKIL